MGNNIRRPLCFDRYTRCRLDLVQGLVQVGHDVVGVFAADAEADHVGRDVGQSAALFALLLVGGDGRDGSYALDCKPSKNLRVSSAPPLTQKDIRWP